MNILITGGASGLGEAITKKLASDKKDTVYFTYHKSINNAKSIEATFINAKGILCNFKSKNDVESLLNFIENNEFHVLINNAYGSSIEPRHFHKTEYQVFSDNFNTNIIPVIRITQKVILQFRKRKFGKIITILSSALIDTPPLGWSEYVAEKTYLASLCKSWAAENIAFNITSNSVSPSFMLTNLTHDSDERVIEDIIQTHPLKQILTTDEVSDTVLFLSKCSQHINGVNLIMNAGSHVI